MVQITHYEQFLWPSWAVHLVCICIKFSRVVSGFLLREAFAAHPVYAAPAATKVLESCGTEEPLSKYGSGVISLVVTDVQRPCLNESFQLCHKT